MKNKELLIQYDNIIQEQLKNGIVEVAPKNVHKSQAQLYYLPRRAQLYYLPHRAVVKASKTTSSVRMVYDGKAKSTKGVYH